MSAHHRTVHVRTDQRETMVHVTELVIRTLAEIDRNDGVVTLFVPHTTAGITINENADPDVQADIIEGLRRIVPLAGPFRHAEGNGDAHLKATLVGASVQVPIVNGRLLLGQWQGIYFCEFDGPRLRQLEVVVG